jgi:membrane protein insertase Oxa1/YidC/SpoIIIJ
MQRVLRQSRLSLGRAAQGSGGRLGAYTMPVMHMHRTGGAYIVQRFNSTGPEKGSDFNMAAVPDISIDSVTQATVDAAAAAAAAAVVPVDAPNFVVAHVMSLIENVHLLAGVPYWEAIVIATIGIRVCLFPVALKTIQGAARMACMRPEMQKVWQP